MTNDNQINPELEPKNEPIPAEENIEPDGEESTDEDGAKHVKLSIRRHLTNKRIDSYLAHRFPDFSRNIIQSLIKEGAVTVNDQKTKNSYKLNLNDKIDITLPPPPNNELPGEDIPLDIVYEDDHIMILNKQANLIVHPSRGHKSGTLVNGLIYYSDSLSNVNGDFRPGIVHRLDKNTTGVITIAKTDTAHWRIAHQFEHRLTRKAYLAIVQGNIDLDADIIDKPLDRHPKVREKFAVCSDTGKTAVTAYQVVKRFQGYTLLKLMPKTGRTHQLRVHCSYIKRPIVADDVYGGKTVTLEQIVGHKPMPVEGEPGFGMNPSDPIISRQALHAYELTFRHPISGELVTFNAPLKPDMQLLIDLLEKYRSIEKPKKKF